MITKLHCSANTWLHNLTDTTYIGCAIVITQAMYRRGFTIVEILVVIIVIAILASITIVAYNGVQQRALYTRALSESSSLSKAINLFYLNNRHFPPDVDRNIPPEIVTEINADVANWPKAPWPNSVYDYDYFTGSDGKDVVQISIRFCPAGGPLSACTFPNESWASGFQVNSSAYWCITGKCRAHPSEIDAYPGYCLNCKP